MRKRKRRRKNEATASDWAPSPCLRASIVLPPYPKDGALHGTPDTLSMVLPRSGGAGGPHRMTVRHAERPQISSGSAVGVLL